MRPVRSTWRSPFHHVALPAVAWAAGWAALFLAGCENSPADPGAPINCTDEIRPALIVDVRDAATGDPVTQGVSVTVRDGEFEEALSPSPFRFTGPAERAGRYRVRVTRAGFVPVEFSEVVVERDECHVQTAMLRADLVPAEDPACLDALIQAILADPPSGARITRFLWNGEFAYYVPAPCCDTLDPAYNTACEIVCHPSGGFGGDGDGACPDFFEEAWDEQLIWEDPRPQ